jgi:hypothetical protein
VNKYGTSNQSSCVVARVIPSLGHRFAVLHLPSATVSKTTFLPLLLTLSGPPASIHRCRFLHWLTSNSSRSLHPSTTASTPVPVTRTQPRTERWRSSRRCSEMHRRDASDTAEPQKARFRCVSIGRPRARTSVAVSDNAQQNDYWKVSEYHHEIARGQKHVHRVTPRSMIHTQICACMEPLVDTGCQICAMTST